MSRVSAFIFDMDGTLLDLEPIHMDAWRRAIRNEYGVDGIVDETFWKDMIGVPTSICGERVAALVAKTLGKACDASQLTEKKSEIFRDIATRKNSRARVYDGVLSSLRRLKVSDAFRLGFNTGSTREASAAMLAHCGLDEYFPRAVRVTNDDVTCGKPDPESYLLAAKRVETPPERCVAFEDSPTGVRSARSAGYSVVCGVTTSFEKKTLADAGAHIVFDSTSNAIEWALAKFGSTTTKRQESCETLVVCDFDWSLVNENSDTYIFDKLRPSLRDAMKKLRREQPITYGKGCWTALMDRCVGDLMCGDDGVSRQEMEDALRTIPVFAETLDAVKLAYASTSSRLVVLSDANTWYIDVCLRHLGIRSCFSEIISNTARWDDDGILRIEPFHRARKPHQCVHCPPNLCKGGVLDTLLADATRRANGKRPRVIYLGDGGGDFCPCLRLGRRDMICARRGWKLHRKLSTMPDRVKQHASAEDVPTAESRNARVVPWDTGKEILDAFKEFFN